MPPRVKAFFLLGFALIVTLLRRVFLRRRDGLADFRANYAADGLAPVTSAQREAMTGFGRCIACGLCDRGEGARIARSGGAYRGLMQLVLASSRSMPDFAAAARGFAHVPEAVLESKEGLCPTGVPFREIARFVRDKSRDARTSLPVAGARVPSHSGEPPSSRARPA